MDKTFNFLGACAFNGIMALFYSVISFLVWCMVVAFACIPFSIVFGVVFDGITESLTGDVAFRVMYAVIFIALMLEEYHIASYKDVWNKIKEMRS